MKNKIGSFLLFIGYIIIGSFLYDTMLRLARNYMLPHTSLFYVGIPPAVLIFYLCFLKTKVRRRIFRQTCWFPLAPAGILYLICRAFFNENVNIQKVQVFFLGFLLMGLCLCCGVLFGCACDYLLGRRRWQWLFLLCVCTVLCSGCQKMNSIETYDYVLAMGVETCGNHYLFHYSVADTSKIAENGGIKVPSKTVSIFAKDFQGGKKIWEKRYGRPLNFSQLKLMVLKPLDEAVINELAGEREISKSVNVVATKKDMRQLFAIEKKLPISFGEYMQQILKNKKSTLSLLTQPQ